MRYLIMETHAAYAVALDERGGFYKVVNRGYQVGQCVEQVISFDEPIPAQETAKDKVRAFPLRHFVAAAACVCLVVVGFVQNSLVAYGAVHLQINPDVMVSLNRQQKVLAVEALNEDGEALLEGYDGRQKTIEVVVDELTTKAEEMGYLAEKQEIHVELISDRSQWRQAAAERVTNTLQDKYEQAVTVTVEESETKLENAEQPEPEQEIPVPPAEDEVPAQLPATEKDKTRVPQQNPGAAGQMPQQRPEENGFPDFPAEEKEEQPQREPRENADDREESQPPAAEKPETALPEAGSDERQPQEQQMQPGEQMPEGNEGPAGHGMAQPAQDRRNDGFASSQERAGAGVGGFFSGGRVEQKAEK